MNSTVLLNSKRPSCLLENAILPYRGGHRTLHCRAEYVSVVHTEHDKQRVCLSGQMRKRLLLVFPCVHMLKGPI